LWISDWIQSECCNMVAFNPKSDIRNSKSRLPPPQFGLRSLLLAVTACAVLAALGRWVSPIALAALVFLVLTIIAHVAGNAIGTRLRELGSQPDDAEPPADSKRRRARAGDFAPATRLGERRGLGWPILIAALAGAIAGGISGALWTWLASRGPVGPLNIAVGAVAFAVLGGIASFAAFGFIQVGIGAIRQAMTSPPARPALREQGLEEQTAISKEGL
jgi:hypothetical protein